MKKFRLAMIGMIIVAALAIGGCFGPIVGVDNVPIADFNYSIADGGLKVTFDASDSTSLGSTIEMYKWDFGDENIGYGKDIIHKYADNADSYHVTLTITNTEGVSDSITQVVAIRGETNVLPIAIFHVTTEPQLIQTGSSVRFNGKNSYDPDGDINRASWDFGDGSGESGDGLVVSHKYNTVGIFTVTLIVRDNDYDWSAEAKRYVVVVE